MKLTKDNITTWKIRIFGGTLLFFFLVGLLFFLRPTTSETEKRELSEFPTLTAESFFSGAFFDGISTWYADTYPGREGLISLNLSLKELTGIKSEKLIINDPPTGEKEPSFTDPTDSGDTTPIEKLGGVYVKGDTAYEVYRENISNSETYAALITKAAEQLSGKATVYDIIVPLSGNVNLSEKEQNSIGCSDARSAISRMFGQMSGVKTLDILDILNEHKSEQLYFRTDHHWTARGAYYAYTVFCKAAGKTPLPLSAWEKYEFNGFLGTLYNEAGAPASLRNHPDTVEAWVPNTTNEIRITDRNGKQSRYSQNGIVRTDTDSFYQNAASKYNCFIMGDNPLSEIHNPTLSDGSSVIVVKESFGNALVPFLVDQYEYVYVVDYRYFTATTGKTLSQFAFETGTKTVLFINNLTATSASPRIEELKSLLGE